MEKKQQEFETEYDKLNEEISQTNENSELNQDQKLVEKDKLKTKRFKKENAGTCNNDTDIQFFRL